MPPLDVMAAACPSGRAAMWPEVGAGEDVGLAAAGRPDILAAVSRPGERVRTLFVSTGGGIDYAGECRGIERAVQGGRVREGWEEPAHHAFVSRQELADKVRRVRPQIFHLSAHGGLDESSGVPAILLGVEEDERPIEFGEDDFVEMVALQRENLRVLYLNCCFSVRMAEGVVARVQALGGSPDGGASGARPRFAFVGTDAQIPDELAWRFADSFYRGLADGETIGAAFDHARFALRDAGADKFVFLCGDRDVVVSEAASNLPQPSSAPPPVQVERERPPHLARRARVGLSACGLGASIFVGVECISAAPSRLLEDSPTFLSSADAELLLALMSVGAALVLWGLLAILVKARRFACAGAIGVIAAIVVALAVWWLIGSGGRRDVPASLDKHRGVDLGDVDCASGIVLFFGDYLTKWMPRCGPVCREGEMAKGCACVAPLRVDLHSLRCVLPPFADSPCEIIRALISHCAMKGEQGCTAEDLAWADVYYPGEAVENLALGNVLISVYFAEWQPEESRLQDMLEGYLAARRDLIRKSGNILILGRDDGASGDATVATLNVRRRLVAVRTAILKASGLADDELTRLEQKLIDFNLGKGAPLGSVWRHNADVVVLGETGSVSRVQKWIDGQPMTPAESDEIEGPVNRSVQVFFIEPACAVELD